MKRGCRATDKERGTLGKGPLKDRLIKDRLVYVEWNDARGITQDWTDVDDLAEGDTCICISIGILLVDTPGHIIILPHFGTDPPNGCGEMVIPRPQVLRMWTLKIGRELKP